LEATGEDVQLGFLCRTRRYADVAQTTACESEPSLHSVGITQRSHGRV
jgi:hypothetical protein